MRLTESTHGYSREKNATHFAFREGREGGGGITQIMLKINYLEISDDFGLRTPRHSEIIFAKKRYTFNTSIAARLA